MTVWPPRVRPQGSSLGSPHTLTLLALGLIVIRVGLALTVPVLPEEAYYVHWGWHPDLSYLDHPPMVAWLARLSVDAIGPVRLGVRLPPLLLGLGGLAALYALGRTTVGRGAAVGGVVLWLAIPIAMGYGVTATPDAPLFLFCVLAWWFASKALLERTRLPWLVAGAATGLATLSKYTAVFVPAGVVLFALLDRDGRRQLSRPWPWMALGVTCIVAAPVLVWNSRHEWVSFAFQSTRRAGSLGGPDLQHPLEFVLSQAALVTPVLFVGMVWALLVALRRSSPRGERLLACFALPNLALMTTLSPFTWIKINWVFPAYGPLALLLAARWARGEPLRLVGPWRGRLVRIGILTGPVLAVIAWFHLVVGVPGVPEVRGLGGWADVTRRVEAEFLAMDPAGEPFLVGAGKNYQVASALAYHLGHRIEVRSVEVVGLNSRQYLYWFDESALLGRDALVIIPGVLEDGAVKPADHGRPSRRLPECFSVVESPTIVPGASAGSVFLFYRCHGYRGASRVSTR